MHESINYKCLFNNMKSFSHAQATILVQELYTDLSVGFPTFLFNFQCFKLQHTYYVLILSLTLCLQWVENVSHDLKQLNLRCTFVDQRWVEIYRVTLFLTLLMEIYSLHYHS